MNNPIEQSFEEMLESIKDIFPQLYIFVKGSIVVLEDLFSRKLIEDEKKILILTSVAVNTMNTITSLVEADIEREINNKVRLN